MDKSLNYISPENTNDDANDDDNSNVHERVDLQNDNEHHEDVNTIKRHNSNSGSRKDGNKLHRPKLMQWKPIEVMNTQLISAGVTSFTEKSTISHSISGYENVMKSRLKPHYHSKGILRSIICIDSKGIHNFQ